MAETITPGTGDRVTSLIRRRDLSSGEAARWTSTPGFQYAEAVDLMKNGVVYKTIYEIYGEGDPSTNYDNATPGSKYTNILCGAIYWRIKSDASVNEWASGMLCILEEDNTTEDFTRFPAGGVNYLDLGGDRLRIKSTVAGSDGTLSATMA